MVAEVLSVGHSTLDYEEFLKLIRRAGVTAIADVRSSPFSRNFPQFNADVLKNELRLDKISYVPLGDQLGGRPKKPELFCNGVADYEKMANEDEFKSGIERVLSGAMKYRVALMCSEHNPLDCHRCLMVGRALFERGMPIAHIASHGHLISQTDIEKQLLKEFGKGDDMFAQGREKIALAYRKRALRVSYKTNNPLNKKIVAAE